MKTKNLKKLIVATLSIMLVTVTAVTLTACGGGSTSSANMTAQYSYYSNNTSDKMYEYNNMAPQYNFRTLTITTQTVTLYDDNTYIFTESKATMSNVTFGENIASADATANAQGQNVTSYYGTYSTSTDALDNVILTLLKPTRIVFSSSTKVGVADTASAAWDETMGNFGKTYGQGDDLIYATADEYLTAKVGTYPEAGVKVTINPTSGNFDKKIAW